MCPFLEDFFSLECIYTQKTPKIDAKIHFFTIKSAYKIHYPNF